MAAESDLFSRLEEIEDLRRVLLKPEALVDKISPVIAEVLEEQIANSGDEIAQAIAPVIGEALRRQIYQAREDIIDALYPVIGQTINKAMGEAIQELARTVDERVRRGFRPQETVRRWQARLRGVSEAEYRLRAALPFAVREVFFIHRESGLLIHHLSSAPETLSDRDLVSGMLTAIRDFAREAFGRGESGELGAIEYEAQQILLEAGGAAYMAAVVDGVPPSGFREEIREALTIIQEEHYVSLKEFDGTDEELIKKTEKVITSSPIKPASSSTSREPLSPFQRFIMFAMMLMIVLPPLVGCGWWVWHVEYSLVSLARPTPTNTPTPTPTPTATYTPTPTSTPTNTPTPTPTNTPTNTPTPTSTPTNTPTPTSTPTPTPSPYTGVIVGNVYLRNAPNGKNAGMIVPLGSSVEILAQYDNWYKVHALLPGEPEVEVTGWVPARWITLLKPVPPELITPTAAP